MSVLVCIPTRSEIDSRTAETALAICANHQGGTTLCTIQAHPIDRCRNLCVSAFLQSPHSHLFFLDSDVVPPADCLNVLLEADEPVVCGMYPLFLDNQLCTSVGIRTQPRGYRFLAETPEEPFYVDAGGMGCCLIAREVFQRVQPPWFQFSHKQDFSQEGEDIFFFEKCAEAGIRTLALPQLMCQHHRPVDLLRLFLVYRRGHHPSELTKPGQNSAHLVASI